MQASLTRFVFSFLSFAILLLSGSQSFAVTQRGNAYVCASADYRNSYVWIDLSKSAATRRALRYCQQSSPSPRQCSSVVCRYFKQVQFSKTHSVVPHKTPIRPPSRPSTGGGGYTPPPRTEREEPPKRDTSVRLCPDGKYRAGGCNLCPDGKYHGGESCQLGPDGNYHGGSPTLCPDGKYQSGGCTLCPDGHYHGGTSCSLGPDGNYHGDGD